MNVGMGCLAAFISIFYVVGFSILGYGVWAARRSTQAAGWPTVQGTITNVAIQTNYDSDGDTYKVKVAYAYTVGGTAHTGSRLAFGYAGSSGRAAHEKIYEKLHNAESVAVRYDPADPSSSVLSVGIHRSIQFMLAFAIIWLAVLFGLTLAWWIASRNDNVLLKNLIVQ
jgi:hypothetical protein